MVRRRLLLVGFAAIGVALVAWPRSFPVAGLEREPARVVSDRTREPLRFFLPRDERWRMPVELDEISPDLRRAIVIAEDRWLGWHPGVNPIAILRAAWTSLRAGRVVSGGSTIAMQVARMADPKPRTLRGKLREAIVAIALTRRLTADELLETYLNLSPFGANIEGIGAAAWFWFGKNPRELSLGESAFLVALPRAPNAFDPLRHPAAALRARERVLSQLARSGSFSPRALADARREPMPTARRRPPFHAPHFSSFLANHLPRERVVVSTLDRRMQTIAERQVLARIGSLRSAGIHDAAVVVIENEGRRLRALVGSPDFFGARGQVNGAVALRSPGSTLKPFLYARAIDDGRLVPESFLLDVPTDFAGYVAENYDGRYRGRVTVREALTESLNASAVRLLADVGLREFVTLLRDGGLGTLDRAAAHYGLPIILGSGEVTLLDLTNLYATLAAGGAHRPVRLIEDGDAPKAEPEHRLFSKEAAELVTRMLTEVKRPDLPGSWQLTRGVPQVAWKTGTSYGHRDAWALGFSARHTIGVWVGNFDGRPQKGISGSEHAGPVLFDLFRAIEEGGARIPERRFVRLATTEVCSDSHELPGPWCPARIAVTTIPGRSRLRHCSLHRRIFLDTESGARLASGCLGRRRYRAEVVTVFPAELVAWWRASGESVPRLPPFDERCRDGGEGEAPRIVSPGAATPYRIRQEAPEEFQRIPLVARAAPAVARLWWYRNGELFAASRPGAPLFLPPERGSYRLVVVDDAGRSDALTYRVE